MIDAAALFRSPEGIDFLRKHEIFISPQNFKEHLIPPASPKLGRFLKQTNDCLIYAGQQTCLDCSASMLSRIRTLAALDKLANISGFFLWLDTDRTGSEQAAMRFLWPQGEKMHSIRVCPKSTKYQELRFVHRQPDWAQKAVDMLGSMLHNDNASPVNKQRYRLLREVFLAKGKPALSTFNISIVHFLLQQQAKLQPRPLVMSEIIESGMLNEAINTFLNCLPEIVQTFNHKIKALEKQNIDPKARPLPEDYLPLHYSCQRDHRRLKLHHCIEQDQHFAQAVCPCGEEYRFALGKTGALDIAELAETGRWSPDIFTPLFLNNLVSGYIAGSSSALYYGLLMQPVAKQVLGNRYLPVLLPPDIFTTELPHNSLLYTYLVEA